MSETHFVNLSHEQQYSKSSSNMQNMMLGVELITVQHDACRSTADELYMQVMRSHTSSSLVPDAGTASTNVFTAVDTEALDCVDSCCSADSALRSEDAAVVSVPESALACTVPLPSLFVDAVASRLPTKLRGLLSESCSSRIRVGDRAAQMHHHFSACLRCVLDTNTHWQRHHKM